MRRFAVALCVGACAVAGFAQVTADSSFHVTFADGREVAIPSVAQETNGSYIIEFVAPPVTVAASVAGKTAIVDYQANFARFRNDLATIARRRAGKTAGEQPEIRREYFVAFHGAAVTATTRDDVAGIRALPYVKRVVADRFVHTCADTNTSKIGADKVWSTLGSRGKGVTVAIIDTGIDYRHPALGGGIGRGFKVNGGHDFVNNDDDPLDDNGHGTHVAGIVAGESATITGVAPDVTLIAYKVLAANGSGSESDVLSAIERTADPNGDGNTSDHVDVANLSLGGGGNPDDPQSTAIDNATAAGVTFAIAAGNGGAFHRISSPGTARTAITVGASDLSDKMASYSSRGPNTKDMAIKPDVVAPGSSILSSYLNNGYAVLSGTSMATPHVAGAAALLKSLHHDWTPAQIKLALMNYATLVQDEIMAQGAGRIDAYAAATGNLVIEPPSINLGLSTVDPISWTAKRTLHLTNRDTKSVTYTAKGVVAAGEQLTLVPSTVTIPAGGSMDVTANFTVDNHFPIGLTSFTGGGQIAFTNAAAPTDVRSVQWAFTRALLTTVTFDRAYPDAIWLNEGRTSALSATFVADDTSEVLTASGNWGMYIFTTENDGTRLTSADFIARDKVPITASSTLALTGAADTPHVISLAARRENGVKLDGSGYFSSGRILIGASGIAPATAIATPWNGLHTMKLSDIPSEDTMLFYEMLLDTSAHNYYMVQHPPVSPLTADATLTTGGSALRGGAVQIAVPPASRSDRRLSVLGTNPTLSTGIIATTIVDAPVVNARVFVSPDVNPNYTYGIAFRAVTDGVTQYTTPLLRVIGDKLVSVGAGVVLPWTYSGTSYEFGEGPRFPSTLFTPITATRASLATDMLGPLGEIRTVDRLSTVTAQYSGSTMLVSGLSSATLDLTTPGPFRIEVVNNGTLVPGVGKKTTVTMNIDSTRADYFPPSLTTMLLLDGSGAIATRLTPHTDASLLFAAADWTGGATSRTYRTVQPDATQVSFRYAGEPAWRPLTATQVVEEAGAGILYRVDLTPVTNTTGAYAELKIDLADTSGNTSSIVLAPAFAIGAEIPPRHRAAR